MASGPSVFRKLRLRSEPASEDHDGRDSSDASTLVEAGGPQPENASRGFAAIPTRLRSNLLQRSTSVASTTSTLSPTNVTKLAVHGQAPPDELGLQLVIDAPVPAGDIIFVHGLGGSAWKTWSYNRDTAHFWPSWLADEDSLSSYRIFTFGYDSNWKGAGTNLNISDFAKDLLLQMLTFANDDRTAIGNKSIIFVAHSMGGLVVKRAFLLGKQDKQFNDIVSSFYGIVFLGTPHRGAQSASILNNILSALPLGPPPKAYIADLQIHSNTLHEINEQFRHHCQELALVSYYETQKTSVGMKEVLIVEKDSAILQLPGEFSSPLYANHHTICKFQGPTDPRYISVRNTISYLAKKSSPSEEANPTSVEDNQRIEAILGIHEAAEDDLKAMQNRVMDGTCQWITQKSDFVRWQNILEEEQGPRVFWMFGLPATGKTTLSSVVVGHLHGLFGSCQYHFFSTSHQTKRTASYALRSIASQLARISSEFREALFAFHAETGIKFTSQDQKFNVIWEKIFEGIIFKMIFRKPLFWIFDAIDEADPQSLFVSSLMKIRSTSTIRIFLSSRPTKVPTTSGTYGSSITSFFLSEMDTEHDIRSYVTNTIRNILPADEVVQQDLTDQVLMKASGSFLWVRLALESLRDNWHTQDDIRKALTELPTGMLALYRQMLENILSQPPRTQLLAKRMLTWVTCSWRPLRVDELKTALEPEFTSFTNFEDTIKQICGHFVSVDGGRIFLIHATARQYLTKDNEDQPAFIQARQSHAHMATRCLGYLSQDVWQRIFRTFSESDYTDSRQVRRPNRLLLAEQGNPLLGYATCYWAYHVSKSPSFSKEITKTLKIFFSAYCLSWIEAVALSANLRYMTRSAKYLKGYAKRKRTAATRNEGSPVLESLTEVPEEDPNWLQSWAIDLIRIVGKFGPVLMSNPSSIYREIPPFCPRNSMLGRTYGDPGYGQLSVAGIASDGWDDRLASITVGDDQMASRVLATEAYFITLVSGIGNIIIWHAETCEQARKIEVGGYVPLVALNKAGTMIATASLTSYTIWEISTGRLTYQIPNITETRTVAISFGQDDTQLIVGRDDCSITIYDVLTSDVASKYIFTPPHTDYDGCPKVSEISPDCTTVAMAWRGKPPIIWHFKATPYQPAKIRRVRQTSNSLCAPESLRWQPDGSSLFVLCQDTNLIEWRVYDDEQISYPHLGPREFEVSRDSNLILTSNNLGTISVWSFPRLSLVYQLMSDNEYIRDITFSPDGQRLYDVRGSICNIWEPDVLVRPDEQDLEDHSSLDELSFVSSEPATAHTDSSPIITAIATSSSDAYYCCGRDDGAVVIYEAEDGKAIRKAYSHPSTSSVLQIYWSKLGRFMVSSDDSARVIAKRLEVKGKDKWAVFPVLDIRLPEPVQQFLCSLDERYLLASTASTDRVYDLRLKQEVATKQWGTRQARRLVQNPLDPDSLVWIEPSNIRILDWATLDVKSSLNGFTDPAKLGHRRTPSHVDGGKAVVWASCINIEGQVLYGTLPNVSTGANMSCLSHSGLHLEYIDLSELDFSTPECISQLASQVKRLVGTYDSKIVYLDHDNRLCTWDLQLGLDGLKRHFFLPRDWLSASSLELALLNEQGTFFCPRNGHVAIVRNGIRI